LRFCSKERRKPRAGSQAQFPKPGFLQNPTFAMLVVLRTEETSGSTYAACRSAWG
jgi:hypothetical protein